MDILTLEILPDTNLIYLFFSSIGFYGVFIASAILHGIAFFYALFFINEPSKDSEKFSIFDFFDPTNAIKTLKIFTKRKLQIGLLLLVAIVVVGPSHGERAMLYLYTRFKFNWSLSDFGYFTTFSHVLSILGLNLIFLI